MHVVNVIYDGHVLPANGFGYLVPAQEPSDILGVVFDSCVFPTEVPTTRLTVMLGGSRYSDLHRNGVV